MHKKGFTFIELMIIVAIISLLMVVILVTWVFSAQNKAAKNAYRTSMQSVRTAVEMCTGSGGTAQSGGSASPICAGGAIYPPLPAQCGSSPYFCVSPASGSNWNVTTKTDASCATDWECRGCRLICNIAACSPASGSNCN